MKILIIGNSQSKENQLLKKEARARKHQVKIISIADLIFSGKKNLLITTNQGQNIANFDAVLFRAINRHIIEAEIIAQYMREYGRIVVDEILARGNYQYHKFFMHSRLWQRQIPQPLTFYPLNFRNFRKIAQKIKIPVVVKHIKEMHGRSNFRFDNKKQLLNFFKNKKRLGQYLIQEWYASPYYYRTLVIGNKVLGTMERLSLHCQNRPSLPLSQRSKKARLSPDLKKISLAATKALGIEFAGLDIMPDSQGHLRVLEINRSPRFKRFTQITGINVAQKVIEYLEKKNKQAVS